jgi:hypothetical protein
MYAECPSATMSIVGIVIMGWRSSRSRIGSAPRAATLVRFPNRLSVVLFAAEGIGGLEVDQVLRPDHHGLLA